MEGHPLRLSSLNIVLLCLLGGLGLGSAVPVLPDPAFCLGGMALALFCLLLYIHGEGEMGLYAACLLGAFCAALLYGHHLHQSRLPDALAGSDWWLEGVVTGLPEKTPQGERFDFRVERVREGPAAAPSHWSPLQAKLRLNDYHHGAALSSSAAEYRFQPGQHWQLRLRLKPPRGLVNGGGFDYEGWLLQQHYRASGYVRDSANAQFLFEQSCPWRPAGVGVCFDRLAFRLWQWIQGQVRVEHRALFAALSVGYGEAFSRAQWDLLRHTGTIHLVVVSGLHVTLMAGLGYFLFSMLVRMLVVPLLLWPAPVWGALGAVVFALGYAGLSGFTLPVQRALVMVCCGLSTWLWYERIRLSTGFLLATLLVLCLDPLAFFSVSFWLSFGAVAILFYSFSARVLSRDKWLWLRRGLKTQIIISVGLTPLLAYWMGSVPLITLLANLFAVPFVTFIILPLVLLVIVLSLFFPAASQVVLAASDVTMDIFWWALNKFQQINYTVYFSENTVSSSLALIFSLLAVAVLFSPVALFGQRIYRWALVLVLCLPMVFPAQKNITEGEFVLTMMDVGQGLALLIETAQHVTVYDVGDRFSDQFDIGRDLVSKQIRRRGYDHIHTLIVSHGDSDHAGGLTGVLSELPVKQILSGDADFLGQRLQADPVFHERKVLPCYAGQHWQVDAVRFDVLSPDAGLLSSKRNNRSCVVKISNHHGSVLLSGDIQKDQERRLLGTLDSAVLASDVLVLPHHGSKSSSSEVFIDAVNPRLALASVGYHNRYGHPHPEVLHRYRQRAIPLLRSDTQGAISLTSADHFERASLAREQSGRYWHRW